MKNLEDETDSGQDTAKDQIALVNRGRRFMQMENYHKAIEDFQKIDISHESKIHQAVLNSYLGFCYLALGQIEPALLLHNNALEIYKGNFFSKAIFIFSPPPNQEILHTIRKFPDLKDLNLFTFQCEKWAVYLFKGWFFVA